MLRNPPAANRAPETMHKKEQNRKEALFMGVSVKAIALVILILLCMASFGKSHAMKKRKQIGQVFTPKYLVQDILDISGYTKSAGILEKHVIDNSCGDGAFLDEIVRRYAAKFLSTNDDRHTLARHLSKYVHGIEIDPIVYEECIRRLNNLAVQLGLGPVPWDIRNADALTIRDYDGKMDYVVGNPPYVRVHNLEENYCKVKSFKFSRGGMTDLYLVFYEIGLRMLSDSGVLCYITPSSWLNSVAGMNMRDYVRANRCLRGIVDLGHYQPFDAMAYTAIVTLCRGNGGSGFLYSTYGGEHLVRKVCRLTYEEAFFLDILHIGDKDDLKSFREIVLSEVPRYVDVKNGFATLADDVFMAEDFPFSEYVIPVLKASTGKWRKCFFPYDMSGRPIPKETLFQNKAIKEYLSKHKDALLKDGTELNKKDWYLFGRTQALKDVAKEKYAINVCIRDASSIKFNHVPSGSGVYSGLYILTEADEGLLRQALLNEAFTKYISMLKKYKSGGYYTFSSRDLERYLNYALHKIQRSSEQGNVTNKQEMGR